MNNGHQEVRSCGSCGDMLADNEHYWCQLCINYHGQFLYARWLEDYATRCDRIISEYGLSNSSNSLECEEEENFPIFVF